MYNGHTHCHKCGQTHWMHGECPARASLDEEIDNALGIPSPKVSPAMQRKIVVYRRKRWVMKQLERLPFFRA
jgi:hypothetical protein